MLNDLVLPDKYKVNKPLTVGEFSSFATLTETEKKIFSDSVMDITLSYVIPYANDSEIVYINVEINYLNDRWTGKNIGRIIAKAFPRNCIAYIHGKGCAYLSVCSRKANYYNECRSTICTQTVLSSFNDEYEEHVENCLSDLSVIVNSQLLDAKEIVLKVKDCIQAHNDNAHKGKLNFDDTQYAADLERALQDGIDKNKEYKIQSEYLDSNEYNDDEDDEDESYIIFDEELEEYYTNIEIMCQCVYALFKETYIDRFGFIPGENQYKEFDWLLEYAKVCRDILASDGLLYDETALYYRIGASFSENDILDARPYLDDPIYIMLKEELDSLYN